MKILDPRSLLLLLIITALSACGDDDSDDPSGQNISDIVSGVEAASTDGSGGGSGGGNGGGIFSGTTIGDCTRILTIIAGSTSIAELNAASCRLDDFSDNLTGQEAADGYVVVLPADGTFTISMSSEDFDSFLLLYSCSNVSCSTLVFFDLDDDSGVGENSEISLDLTEGTYLILASEFSASEPDGDYILTTTFDNGSATL